MVIAAKEAKNFLMLKLFATIMNMKMKPVELPELNMGHKNAPHTHRSSWILCFILHEPLMLFSQQIKIYIRTGIILALWEGSLISELSFHGSFGE